MKTNKFHTFHINVLIQFLVSSTCFIIRKTICPCSLYGTFFMHLGMQSSQWKALLYITNCYKWLFLWLKTVLICLLF